MAKIAPDLQKKLQLDPDAVVNLILRLTDSPDQHVNALKARGLAVLFTYSLIPAVAVQGKASACLGLIDEPWVLAIEEDKPVHTL